jgi:hypothetical protein
LAKLATKSAGSGIPRCDCALGVDGIVSKRLDAPCSPRHRDCGARPNARTKEVCRTVPLYIAGTFAAWSRQQRFPSFRPISVTFGRPEPVEAPSTRNSGSEEGRIAAALRREVLQPAATTR